MSGCPLAYADPCGDCARYGSCTPSLAVAKLESLEAQVQELKRLLEQLLRGWEDFPPALELCEPPG